MHRWLGPRIDEEAGLQLDSDCCRAIAGFECIHIG